MKKSCPVCGQGRCVKSDQCVEYRTKGTINGVPTQIILPLEEKKR